MAAGAFDFGAGTFGPAYLCLKMRVPALICMQRLLSLVGLPVLFCFLFSPEFVQLFLFPIYYVGVNSAPVF